MTLRIYTRINMILINPITKILLNGYISNPSSTLMLIGSDHHGINEISQYLSDNLLGKAFKNNKIIVEPEEGKSILINQIRDLKKSLTTKIISKSKVGRVAIIRQADLMTNEAQNAVLKLVEEPVDKTSVILEVRDPSKIITTIKSRCQTIKLLPITKDHANQYSNKNSYSVSSSSTAFLLSKGQAKLYQALLENDVDSAIINIQEAKHFLALSTFEKLNSQNKYSKYENLSELLEGLDRIAEAGMHFANIKTLNRWTKIVKTIRECQKLLKANVNVKLIFLRLCIEL
jgi:DNA polymerase III subunit delta'